MADYALGPNSAAIIAARADGYRGLARAMTATSMKAQLMVEHGLTSNEAEVRLFHDGRLGLDELNSEVRAQLAAERRAIVADLVHEMCDRYDIEEREAMYRLLVANELGPDDVPADVYRRFLDRTIGLQYG